ncbi:MAG: ABC transporter permease [Clostridia bacterium]|nr:ABC transporter permease [Clostridia bacterium]MBR5365471.1 ABC transporter permease [Clostridia bacterium]
MYLVTYAFRNLLRHRRNLRTGLLLFACLSILCCMLNLGGALRVKLDEATAPYRDLYNLRFRDELQYNGNPAASSRNDGAYIVNPDGTKEFLFAADAMREYDREYLCTLTDVEALTDAISPTDEAVIAAVTPVYRIERTPEEYRTYSEVPEQSVIECYLLSGDPDAFVWSVNSLNQKMIRWELPADLRLAENECVITKQFAARNGLAVGDEFSVREGVTDGDERTLRVAAIVPLYATDNPAWLLKFHEANSSDASLWIPGTPFDRVGETEIDVPDAYLKIRGDLFNLIYVKSSPVPPVHVNQVFLWFRSEEGAETLNARYAGSGFMGDRSGDFGIFPASELIQVHGRVYEQQIDAVRKTAWGAGIFLVVFMLIGVLLNNQDNRKNARLVGALGIPPRKIALADALEFASVTLIASAAALGGGFLIHKLTEAGFTVIRTLAIPCRIAPGYVALILLAAALGFLVSFVLSMIALKRTYRRLG